MSDISRVLIVAASAALVTFGTTNARGQVSPAGSTRSEPALARRVRLDTIARAGNTFTARLEGGATAELTLDARLQDAAEDVFQSFQIPYAAAVVVSVQDGRILAYACMATLGGMSCILSFGIGERLMILSSLATLNTLLLSDLLE